MVETIRLLTIKEKEFENVSLPQQTTVTSYHHHLKKIPTGSESFEEVIHQQFIHVDKTDLIHQLMNKAPAIFISRPSKFGKSQVLDIVYYILSGNKELFKGLKIYNLKSDWKQHAVLRLNFSDHDDDDILHILTKAIEKVADQFSIPIKKGEIPSRLCDGLKLFAIICNELKKRQIPMAILVDDCDLPIIKNVKLSQELSAMFNHFKNSFVSFFMATSMHNFSLSTYFLPSADHIQDFSWDKVTSSLFGYTKDELERYFRGHLELMANLRSISIVQLVQEIRNYYDGYYFSLQSGAETVMNPYDINRVLSNQCEEFKPYGVMRGFNGDGNNNWIKEVDIPKLIGTPIDHSMFSKIDPMKMFTMNSYTLVPSLIQRGLLTIREQNEKSFVLDIPNEGVLKALQTFKSE